jgi:hypothetical protein
VAFSAHPPATTHATNRNVMIAIHREVDMAPSMERVGDVYF